MSIKVMSMVFDRYHAGGGEMLLALAIADHANDLGGDIFPSIKMLADKTRQSERTVQYQLRKMEESGWLILVNSGNGGRNQRREYIISPAWMKGANIAPLEKGAIDDVKGANDDTKGCNSQQERVQPIAPAYNRHRTIKEPSKNHQRGTMLFEEVFEQAWTIYPKRAGGNSKAAARKAWNARVKSGVDPEDMLAGTQRYAAYCLATGRVGTQFVRQAATFFGPDLHFEDEFDIPLQQGTKADRHAAWNARMSEVLAQALSPQHHPIKDMGAADVATC